MPPTCIPRHAARSEQSRPIRPILGRTRKQTPLARRGHSQVCKIDERRERARHTPRQRVVAKVAAHPKRTRPLGGTTPHPQQRCAPTVPAHRTHRSGASPLSTPQSHRVPEVPSESTATALLPHRPRSMPPTCIPRHAALLGAEPTDPALLGCTCKRRWQEGGTHSNARLVSAESELGTLPVSALWVRSLHTRSGLGRSGGTTPHPQQPCASCGTRAPYPQDGVPLEYSSVT